VIVYHTGHISHVNISEGGYTDDVFKHGCALPKPHTVYPYAQLNTSVVIGIGKLMLLSMWFGICVGDLQVNFFVDISVDCFSVGNWVDCCLVGNLVGNSVDILVDFLFLP